MFIFDIDFIRFYWFWCVLLAILHLYCNSWNNLFVCFPTSKLCEKLWQKNLLNTASLLKKMTQFHNDNAICEFWKLLTSSLLPSFGSFSLSSLSGKQLRTDSRDILLAAINRPVCWFFPFARRKEWLNERYNFIIHITWP